MIDNGGDDLTPPEAARRRAVVHAQDALSPFDPREGSPRRLWLLGPAEIALLVAAVVVVVLGARFTIAEAIVAAFEPWQIDEFFLALPLVTLALGLTLRLRTSAWQRQNACFRAMVEHAADGVAIVAGDGVLHYASPTLAQLLGQQPAAWTGRQILPLVHPEDVARLRKTWARLLEAPGASGSFDCRLRHQDGTWRDVEVAATNRLADAAVAGIVLNIRDMTARKAAAPETIAAIQREHRVLEQIADGYTTLDPDWHFTSVNAATERMLGLTREFLIGRNAWEVFAPAVETPVYAAALQAARDGRPTTVEFFYRPLDAWFDIRFDPSPEGMSVLFHDVTQRLRLTEELRASEARYRALLEQVPAVIYTLAADEQATRHYFSPYVAELTGFTPEEVVARTEYWLAWVHPADRARVAALESSTEAGGNFRAEYRLLRKDGSYVWVRDECVPVRDDKGVITDWQGVMLDISPRVEAEDARSRLAAIIDSAEDAICSMDLSGNITSWNRGAEKLYGFAAEEMVGRSMAALLPAWKIEGALAERIAAAEAGASLESYTTARPRRDGSLVDVTVSLSPIRDHAGNVMGFASIARDITAWIHAEEQLQVALDAAQVANATKSQFLAMMSHELRTPLQAVLGYTELLLANAASKLTVEERNDLRYIQQGGLRMLNLINQLLDLSRIEAGRLEVAHKPVDLAEIVELVRQDVAPQASQKGLALRIDLPASLPPVVGDPERLRQILLNLVGNAVKFTDAGLVTIRATVQDVVVAITVTDTGIGIPPEDLPQIFEAFRQADNTLARRHGGAGLGLAIAQRLAELMEGEITVESRQEEGSTFTLVMPAFIPPRA
ncbi:MAG: PAS domain S-box protein [Chloroflexota bacterium]|nr:PAS domain S-box protein [Chloroflexota bacterium]